MRTQATAPAVLGGRCRLLERLGSGILIAERDGVAKLVDFGVAIDLFATDERAEVAGTPGYIAPETLSGAARTPQSDLYSLGVVAYRLLGGPSPAERTLPSLAEVRPELPRALTAAVEAVMARRPAARPASPGEFRARLIASRAEDVELRAA